MFYYLNGTLEHVGDGFAVVDCGGVGYKLNVSGTTSSQLLALTGAGARPTVRLYTHFSVREDAAELFGFYTSEELDTFRLLIGISGVGPKAALSVLSLLSPASLAEDVAGQDVKMISRAPGVGTKTAQRIVLELSGKLVATAASSSAGVTRAPLGSAAADAADALVVLGYSRADAQAVVASVDGADSKTTEEIIRLALMRL